MNAIRKVWCHVYPILSRMIGKERRCRERGRSETAGDENEQDAIKERIQTIASRNYQLEVEAAVKRREPHHE